jgi:hypothetical protein
MKEFTEEEIIKYVRDRRGYVTDNDFNIRFIPKESEIYFQLHNLVAAMVAQGKLTKTIAGYKIADGKA